MMDQHAAAALAYRIGEATGMGPVKTVVLVNAARKRRQPGVEGLYHQYVIEAMTTFGHVDGLLPGVTLGLVRELSEAFPELLSAGPGGGMT